MTSKILSMTDFESALRGEIASAIYHTPDDTEMAEFEQYIADYISDCINAGKNPDLTGICIAISDCRHDKFKECADCGEYFLYDEMNQDYGHEYCLRCKPHYDPDFEWKQNKEQE